jgi:hypothetical protein
MNLQSHYPASAKLLEDTWIELCGEAGWTADLNCTPNQGAFMRYAAKLDALIADRAPMLRAMIGEAKLTAKRFDLNYVEGIEAAIDRAIANPRKA